MPQINQLALVAYSQFFWLLLVLGLIYFGIGKGMLPKIQSTVDARDRSIADDLAAAEAARTAADAVEAAYRERMDDSRAQAAKLTAQAKADSAVAAEKTLAEIDASLDTRLGEAQARIRKARGAAVKDIAAVAAELAKDITAKVARIDVSEADAAAAVKRVMADA